MFISEYIQRNCWSQIASGCKHAREWGQEPELLRALYPQRNTFYASLEKEY